MQGHVRAWEFIVNIGPHPVTRRRHQKNQSGFATKREAKSALHEFIRHVEAGGDPPERIGLGDQQDGKDDGWPRRSSVARR